MVSRVEDRLSDIMPVRLIMMAMMNDDWEAVDDYWDLSYYETKRLVR